MSPVHDTVGRGADQRLATHSLRLIIGLQTPEGAYPASPTFPAYVGYCWLRDGAFIADAVSACGEQESASRFFDWCADVVMRRSATIAGIVADAGAGRPRAPADMLPARFTFAGDDGSDPWWDFQLDGYGTWLWALGEHLSRHKLDGSPYRRAIDLTVDYLMSSWERPCYDWWEEHAEHVHVSTLACVASGLTASLNMTGSAPARQAQIRTTVDAIHAAVDRHGTADGHLLKWFGNTGVDASLAATIAPLGFVDAGSPTARHTVDILDAHLCVNGGVHRYLGDTFFGGGQWPLLSCFLGLAHLALGDVHEASDLYEWASATATEVLELPEQVDGHLIAPGMQQYWVDRWGPAARPLLWSHAMLLKLGLALGRVTPESPTQNGPRR